MWFGFALLGAGLVVLLLAEFTGRWFGKDTARMQEGIRWMKAINMHARHEDKQWMNDVPDEITQQVDIVLNHAYIQGYFHALYNMHHKIDVRKLANYAEDFPQIQASTESLARDMMDDKLKPEEADQVSVSG